jgi:hypothetical protein
MYRVDITGDLNDEDQTGYVWTFLDEARDPAQITPGALVVAGDEDAAAVCQVVDLVPAGDGTIVHLRLLPGLATCSHASNNLRLPRGSSTSRQPSDLIITRHLAQVDCRNRGQLKAREAG